MVNGLQKKHWLEHVLRRAGSPGAEDLDIEPGTPAAEAWMTVCDTTGMTQDQLAKYVADYFRLKVAALERAESTAIKLVPEKVARQYSIFPLREDDRQLTVATSDPTNFSAEQALGFISGRKAIFEVAPPPFILDFINASYSPDGVIESLLSRVDEAIASSVSVVRDDDSSQAVSEAEADAAPVIKLTNLILRDAAMNGASDVHIEPGASGGTVRFRIDGVLRNYMQLPLPALIRVVSRIKIMGNLDIADKWRPHDGRTRVIVDGRPYDIRISTVPTREAEKVVLRILKGGQAAKLSEIGLPAWELGRLRQLLSNRDGIVCVTGPTGSGKTTTLYAAIRELATGEVNIMTVEDPVEYELPGITQIQVQTKRGVTFASALRAILRQDPDVILVGEIRDKETAEVAVQAAMTGHLVLATLHTNDAVSVVARLLDIGLDRASIAATLRGALAQRLVRKVCDECGEPIRGEMTEDEIRLAKLYNLRPPIRSVGCRRCAETGYRGRIPVQEVFLVNSGIADQISGGATYSELYASAIASGMRPLLHVGLERVRTGDTTLDELERVLGMEAEDSPAVAAERAEALEAGHEAVEDRPDPSDHDDPRDPPTIATVDAADPADESEPERTETGSERDLGNGTGKRYRSRGGRAPEQAGSGEDGFPEPGTGAEEGAPFLPSVDGSALLAELLGEKAPAADDEVPLIDLDSEGVAPRPTERPRRSREPSAGAAGAPPGGLTLGNAADDLPVLVVDDDPEDRLLVRTILQKHGYRVEQARDGQEALGMIGLGDSHSLVVLDLEMPTVDGREVLARLRSSGATIALPVIVLTGSPDPDDEYRLMEAGADDYLRKPLDPPRFMARVRATLRRARMT